VFSIGQGTPSCDRPSGEPTLTKKLPYNISSSILFHSFLHLKPPEKEYSFQKNQILLWENRESCKRFWNILYIYIYIYIYIYRLGVFNKNNYSILKSWTCHGTIVSGRYPCWADIIFLGYPPFFCLPHEDILFLLIFRYPGYISEFSRFSSDSDICHFFTSRISADLDIKFSKIQP
jgi:hypothetical protein